ncbi:hypothetical protein SAMN05216204_12123 [Massilia yuzhufengensis]|uniref:Uncharacterized protein n=1 Tax=Massilia yuzhufengensis TaxID=1164594 RepID=A0A1I1R4N4_9BURK|nr:hypothetical protein SAMN05216204_12123 [Massilia yuzhufengensis]
MKVNNPGIALVCAGLDDLTDFLHYRSVHFTVQQYLTGLNNKVLGPNCDQYGANDTHCRV